MNKKKIIIYSSLVIIAGVAGYVIYRRYNAKKVIADLTVIVDSGKGLTGTIADVKESDLAFDVNYWARLVDKKTLKLDSFNLKVAQKSANDILKNLADADIVKLLKTIKTKAQMSYLAYYYFVATGRKQTLLQKIKKMSKENSNMVMAYTNSLPDF